LADRVETFLSFAEELERRDADVARELAKVERLQADVDELRARTAAVSGFLTSLPGLVERHDADARAAAESRDSAVASLREAESALEGASPENERLAAERIVQLRRDELHDVEAWLAQVYAARAQLDRDAEQQREETERIAGRAAELAEHVRDVPPPVAGLEGAADWGSRARGALLVRHAGLVDERDKLVREASELVASVLGEPLLVTGVVGVRARLERALRQV
jgi:chromosome segregation ATPase